MRPLRTPGNLSGRTTRGRYGRAMTLLHRKHLAAALRELGGVDESIDVTKRSLPATRGECPQQRPCPYLSCVHHLATDTKSSRAGHLAVRMDWESMRDTCALDVAEHGGLTLEQVGFHLGLTRERVRQIEQVALDKLRETAGPALAELFHWSLHRPEWQDPRDHGDAPGRLTPAPRSARVKPVVAGVCVCCGEMFALTTANQSACSDECSAAHTAKLKRADEIARRARQRQFAADARESEAKRRTAQTERRVRERAKGSRARLVAAMVSRALVPCRRAHNPARTRRQRWWRLHHERPCGTTSSTPPLRVARGYGREARWFSGWFSGWTGVA